MPRRDRDMAPELMPIEFSTIASALEKETNRRRKLAPSRLIIKADGASIYAWDLFAEQIVTIEINSEAREVIVSALQDDDEIPLAVYLPRFNRPGADKTTSSVVLEARQQITFSLSSVTAGEADTRSLVIGYRENNPIRAVALEARRRCRFIRARYFDRVLSPSGIVTALIFCLVLSISICLFLINSRTTGFESAGVPGFAQEDGGSLAGTNSNSTPPETPLHEDDAAGKTVRSEAPGDIESETEKPASRKTRVPRKRSSATGQTSGNLSPGMREGDPAQIEGQAGTRSLGQAKKGAELSRVKSIYVDSFVGVRRGEVVRQEFEIEIERASLTAAKEPAKADAVLVGKTARGKGNRRQLQVRLINRAGEVLWSGSVPLAGADSDSAMRQAIQDLIRIIKDQQK